MEQNPAAAHPIDTTVVGALYTTEEVGKMLRVSQRTVQDWIRSGTLVAVRYGRLLRIRQADLATFGEVLPRRTPSAIAEDVSPRPAPAGTASVRRGRPERQHRRQV
jgi:excisionase family DNA binding protein